MEILEQVLSQTEQYGDRPFLLDALGDRTFTYADAHRQACRLAEELRSRGVDRGDRVGLLLGTSAEFALLYFACLYLGAVAVPVNPGLHRSEIDFILGHSGVRLIVYSPATRHLLDRDGLSDGEVGLWQIVPPGEQAQDDGGTDPGSGWPQEDPPSGTWQPFSGVAPDDLFSITFTSGTTSLPKGVPHRIGSLLRNAAAFNAMLRFGPSDRFLHVFPMAYMAGFLNTLLCPFMAGAAVVLAHPFDAQSALRFWQPVMRYRADTFWLAPTMLAALLRIDRDPGGQDYCREYVKTICVGTAPLPLKTKQEFERKYGLELFESYGLSELLFVSANTGRYPRVDGSVGRLLPDVEAMVTDDLGARLATGEDGEISVKTPFITAGYLDYDSLQPDRLEAKDWFPTGDIGHLSAAGDLFITGRKKDLIIRGGINVSPRSVEEALLTHEAVAQVAVIGLPHDFYGEEVVAVLTLKPGRELAAERSSLEALCRASLSAPAVPTRFVALDQFPTSANGKLQKHKLRESLMVPGFQGESTS